MKKLIFFAFAGAILTGCASATKSTISENETPTDEYSIVFGSVADYGLFGLGQQFKNRESGEKVNVNGAKGVFILKMKPGHYVLSSRGIHGGGSVPCSDSPIEFNIPAKSLVYVGSTFSNLQSDKYYYDLKGLEKSKTQGPFDYCKVNPLSGNPVKHMAYRLYVYNNFEMDRQNLLLAAPQLKDQKIQNQLQK